MLSEPELRACILRVFPIVGPMFSVELATDGDPIELRDDFLCVTMRLVIRDDRGIRDVKEQQVHLLPARHHTARGLAFVEQAAARIAQMTADSLELMMPHDLFPSALLDVPGLPIEALMQALDDPRTQQILAARPDDPALLARIDPSRRAPPVLANAELEARIIEDAEASDAPALCAVYGDWLAERGDPRGELVAVQLALEATPDDEALRAREQRLLDEYAYEWLGRFAWVPATEVSVDWRRGFLHAVRFGVEELDGPEPSMIVGSFEIQELARLPGTRFVRRVELLRKGYWDDAAFEAIGEHGLPPAAIELAVTTAEYQELGDLEPAYPGLTKLRELRLESRALELGTIELPALRSLELVTRGLTRANLRSLREASWPALERLVLWLGEPGVHDCDIELTDLDWILAGERLGAVRELGLCGRDAGDLLERLLDAPILPQLRILDLAGGDIDDRGEDWLVHHAAAFAHLQRLSLPRNLLRRDRAAVVATIGPHVVVDDRFIPVYE